MDNVIWSAGFLDGEGTVTIKRTKYYRDKNKHYYMANISCGQTMKGLEGIEMLKNTFGGSYYVFKQKGIIKDDVIQWCITSKSAIECIKKLQPYLILKKKHAEVLIKFGETIHDRKDPDKLTDEEYKLREEMFYEMRKLNTKGKLCLKRLNEEAPEKEMR